MAKRLPKTETRESTKNLPVRLPEVVYEDLKELAEKSGISLNAYVNKILSDAAKDGALFRVVTELKRISGPQNKVGDKGEDSEIEHAPT